MNIILIAVILIHKSHWHIVLFVLDVYLTQITRFSQDILKWKGNLWFQFILSDHKEQEVKCLDSALTPEEQVQLAIECLPTSSEKAHNGTNSSFSRWTIMDYSRAYSSGEITPLMVFHHLDIHILLACPHPFIIVSTH